jgi:hypothetical protein
MRTLAAFFWLMMLARSGKPYVATAVRVMLAV